MKDIAFIPLLAGILLAVTLAMAALGAKDAAEPFPVPMALENTQSKPDYRVVADWSGVSLP